MSALNKVVEQENRDEGYHRDKQAPEELIEMRRTQLLIVR